MILYGACHCGQVEVAFETAMPVADPPLRTCYCSFCRRHGTKAVADPNGRLTISAPPDGLSRYRFGLRTADYLICRTCGAYDAAVITGDGEERATLNVTATAISELTDRRAEPLDYERESVDDRRTRQLTSSTPSRIPASASRDQLGWQTTDAHQHPHARAVAHDGKGQSRALAEERRRQVKSGDVIAEIETDKATMEYEAVDEGTLAKIVVPEGTQDVAVNSVIAVLAGEGEDVKAAASAAKQRRPRRRRKSLSQYPPHPGPLPNGERERRAVPQAQPLHLSPVGRGRRRRRRVRGLGFPGNRIFASPLARRLAKEAGIDLAACRARARMAA